MYKILLISILVTFLAAANPKPYSALGDVIYDNLQTIESLKELDIYAKYQNDIDTYINEVTATKALGYKIEKGIAKESKKEYLERLRNLSTKNDYFMRTIKSTYTNAMKEKKFDQFTAIINGHYIDTDKNKQEIIDYYFKNQEDINSSGVIDEFLAEDAALKARKEAQRKHYKTKKQREEEKIKRIRENDKENQERIEKELEKDLETKKLKIREHQKKELAN